MNKTDFLSKANQNVLREMYKDACSKYWVRKDRRTGAVTVDEKMIKFLIGDADVIAQLTDGNIITFSKPRIDKDFWVGYSDCGQGITYDEANDTIDAINRNLAEYFKSENMRGVDDVINEAEIARDNIEKGYTWDICVIYPHWCGQSADSPLRDMRLGVRLDEKPLDPDCRVATVEDMDIIIAALKQRKANFEKRLDTYLKRFGTSKLHVGRYWVDR